MKTIKDLVYEAKAKARLFFSRPRPYHPRPRPMPRPSWGQQGCMKCIFHWNPSTKWNRC